jgi:hypothetical protein
MQGYFYWTSTDYKQLQIRNKTLKLTVLPQAEAKEKDMKYICFPWPPLVAALSSVLPWLMFWNQLHNNFNFPLPMDF